MSIEAIRELETLASVCPELNMANHAEDDVRHLNDWAIEMSLLAEKVAAILALPPERVPMTEGTARQFVEWMKTQPDDREPTTIDGALAEFEAHHGITAKAQKGQG